MLRGQRARRVPGPPSLPGACPLRSCCRRSTCLRQLCCTSSSPSSRAARSRRHASCTVAAAMEIFWFIPTHGDGRYLGTTRGARPVSHPYCAQIARAADELGYGGVLLPTGRSCEDAWIVAATLVPLTRRLRFLVAIRPGVVSPTASARETATLDRMSDGRVLINVVTGGDPAEAEGDGIFLSHDERYAVTDEFL